MHDIKEIRNNTEDFLRAMKRRGIDIDIDALTELDRRKRSLTTDLDNMRKRRNSVSKDIGKKKKGGEDTSGLEKEMRDLGAEIKSGEERERELDGEINRWLLQYPNIPDESTPEGLTESENKVERFWGEAPVFDFETKDHLEIAERLGILDFKRGSKIAGSGFPVWSGMGMKLERALLNFMLDLQANEYGYREMMTPFIANRDSMTGSGQIPKLEEDMYRIEKEDLFLIPTSEVTLINLHRDEILTESELPLKYTAYSPCFRREAGAYGAGTRGFLRTHQFNKVEIVQFVKPEASNQIWEEMIEHAEAVLRKLELHYRVVRLCCGEMGFNAASCIDLEVWAPADGGKWLEVSSISNCRDFQSRRANIRFRPEGGGKLRFPHILNGSALATSRLLVALIENYQTDEGSIAAPSVLRPYLNGVTVITAGKETVT